MTRNTRFGLTVDTTKSVAHAIEAVENELKSRKFAVLWHLDMQEKLREKGVEGGPEFHVLEVCSAPRAKEALDADLYVGYLLPCKIVVFREHDATRIGLLRPTILMDFFEDERLRRLAEEVEATLTEVVRAAA